MPYILLFVLIFSIPCITQATVYVKEDSESIVYSDAPLENGKKLEDVPTVNTIVTTTTTGGAATTTSTTTDKNAGSQIVEVEEKKPYTTFAIVAPKDQETIQNQPDIPVDIKVEPELQAGDKIMLLLDEKPWGAPVETGKVALTNVERGMHTVGAVIIDKNQKIVKKSNVVTIYIHRATLNTPTRNTNTVEARRINLIESVRRLFA